MRISGLFLLVSLTAFADGAALAQISDPLSAVAVWPTPEGFQVRVQQQVVELDFEGAVVGQSANQALSLGSEPPRLVLPASGNQEAVAVLDAADNRNGPECERVDAGGGRKILVVRLATLSSEWMLPVARDQEGLIYAKGLSLGGRFPVPHVQVYAPDCHLLGRIELDANDAVQGIAASSGQRGVWIYVSRGGSASMRRYVGLQFERAFEIEGGLGEVSSMAVSPDGALLAAARRFDRPPTKLGLHRFDPSNPGSDFQSMFFGGEYSYGFAFVEGHIIHAAQVRDENFDQFLGLLELDAQLRVRESGFTRIANASQLRRVVDQAEGMQGNAWAIDRGQNGGICLEASTCQVFVGRLRRGPSLEILSPAVAGRPALFVGSDGSVIRGGIESGRLRLYRSSAGADSLPFATKLEGLALSASSYRSVAMGPVNPSLPGGAGSLVLSSTNGGTYASAYDLEGRERWQARLTWSPRVAKWLTSTAPGERACVAMSYGLLAFTGQNPIAVDVVCLDTLTGEAEPLVSELARADGLQLVGGNASAHGELVLYHVQQQRTFAAQQPTAIVQTRLSPGDAPQRRLFVSQSSNPEAGPLRVIEGPLGRFLFVDDSTGSLLLRHFNSDGSELASRALSGFRARPTLLAVDASGGALLAGPATSGGDQLVSIGSDGQEDWRVSLQNLAPGIDKLLERFATARAFVDPASRSWLLLVFGEDGLDRLFAIDRANGQTVADLALPDVESNARTREAEFSLDPTSGDVTLARRQGRSLEFRRIDAAGGRVGAPTLRILSTASDWFQRFQPLARDWYLQDGQVSAVFAPTANAPQRAEVRRYGAPALAADVPLSEAHAGLWFDPQSSGQGLLIDVQAGQGYTFGTWFTFAQETFGQRDSLRWYSMLARDASGHVPVGAELFQTRGGDFSGSRVPQTESAGVAGLRAIDCNTLEFSYSIPDANDVSAPVLTGARRLQRLGPAPASCGGTSLSEQSGLSSASTGSWVLEGRPSQGVLMQVDPGAADQPGALWGAWFGFDAGEPDDAFAQHWLTVVGRSATGQPGVVELEWMRTLGGSFDAQPTRNTTVVGSGRLRFTACDRAVLEYSFDAPGLAGDAFAGLQGQVNLRRFEPCR